MFKTGKWIVVLSVLITAAQGCSDSSDSSQCTFDATNGFDASECVVEGVDNGIVLNEFTADGNDEVELLNVSDTAINIGGWLLTDQVEAQRVDTYDPLSDDEKFIFPAGTTVAPGAYVVIAKGSGELEHSFGISKESDIVSLVAPNGALVDQAGADNDQASPSYCRVPDGTGAWQTCEATFGSQNRPFLCGNGTLDNEEQCDGTALGQATCSSVIGIFDGGALSCNVDCTFNVDSCTSSAPCDSDAVVLNEVCHKNSVCGVEGTTTGDWIEVHNPTDQRAELSGCYIQVIDDNVVQRRVLIGSVSGYETATLEPGGFWLVSGNDTLFKAGKDEQVLLLDGEQNEINGLVTSSALVQDGNVSGGSCRIDDGMSSSTPGDANNCSP